MRFQNTSIVLVPLGAFFICAACAGPFTPFGSIDTLHAPKKSETQIHTPGWSRKPSASYTSINFSPDRQVLHDRSPFQIKIVSPEQITKNMAIQVLYNDFDLTKKVLSQSKMKFSPDRLRLTLDFPHLRLRAQDTNKIKVLFKANPRAPMVSSEYYPPVCEVFSNRQIRSTGRFSPSAKYIRWINQHSKSAGINPTYTAGLIAQESGFNPKAVSWSRAIGLTQVTPIASKDIRKLHKNWPTYRGLASFSAGHIKSLIHIGKIDAQNEWTLDPNRSIQGGVTYIEFLVSYWQKPSNQTLLKKSLNADDEREFAKVILASYNSGASRVSRAIKGKGSDWLNHKELGEAKKYVHRVFSYCYHFGKQGG